MGGIITGGGGGGAGGGSGKGIIPKKQVKNNHVFFKDGFKYQT